MRSEILHVYPTPDDLGAALATEMLAAIADAGRQGTPWLLGCPAGRSAVPVYRQLARLAAERQADLSHVVLAMMDD